MADDTLPADPRDGMYDWPGGALVVAIEAIDARTGPGLLITVPVTMYVATDILNATAPLIRAAERERAERAEAVIAEVRQAMITFRNRYAGTLGDQASDVISAVLQVTGRTPLGTQERSDGKRPS